MKKTLLSIACLLGSLFSNAQSGAALDFDGGDDYIDIGTAITQTNSYTKEAWIYANSSGSNNIISSQNSPFWLAGGQLSVAHGWGGGFILSDPSSFPLNVWTHVAVTFDSPTNTLILYKNGVPVATSNSAPAYVAENIQIGAYQSSNFFQGMIDEVRLWDVVRTQCEINSYMNCEIPTSSTGLVANYHFNQGIVSANNSSETSLTDATGTNPGALINFSLNGSTSNWVSPGGVTSGNITPSVCPPAAALNFDGVNDQIACGNGSSINNLAPAGFTMEAWINPSNLSGGGAYSIIRKPGDYNLFLIFGHLWAEIWTAGTGNSTWKQIQGSTPVSLNAWTHVAAVWNGTTCVLYQNGVIDASTSSNGNIGVSSDLFIGSNEVSSEFFTGSMDEVRIWNIDRTQCEINSYMNCEIPSSSAGLVANYHFNQGIASGNNSSEMSLIDATGNNPGMLINFSLITPSSNWVSPGGVISGNTTPSVCPPASALNFDGSDDHVTLNPINIGGAAARTIEFWIKTNFTGNFQTPFASGSANPSQAFNFKVTPSGYLGLMGYANDIYPSSGTYIADNAFHHVAITYDGTTAKGYVDGNHEWDFTAALNTVGENNLIGWSNHGGFEQPFGGTIDELRIWNVVRTQCEIISYKNCEIPASSTGLVANYHFNQGYDMMSNPSVTTLTDASGNANDGTLSNFALTGASSNWVAPGGVVSGFSTSIVCPLAAALDLDGSDDFVLIPDATINDLLSGTIEAWVYLASNNEEVICAKQHNFVGSYAILAVGISGTPGQISFSSKNGSIIYSNINLSTGQWYHVAATFDGSGANLYVNGVLDATTSGDFTVPNDLSTDGTSIGAWLGDGGGKYLDGQIDEFRVWNVARTQCEINTYMNSEISNSMTGLLANYHFNQGIASYSNPTETTLTDASGNGYDGTLNNFGLTGTTSNWVAPGGVVSGYTTTLAPPVISINSGAICAGESFTMVPTGALTYTYSNGSAIATPTTDATYSVSGTDANGCVSVTDAISSVTVNALPTISVNSGTICSGSSFTMVPSGADTYTYSNGSDIVAPTSDATYTVSGTDANGCLSSIDAVSSVTVNALPTLMAMTSNTLLCSGETATLSVMGNATTYTWSTTETTMDIVVTPTTQTTYTVDGTDANGCSNTTTLTQDVSLCTGIVSNSSANSNLLNIYPNPNNGLFMIELNTISQVSVTNALGQVVFTKNMEAGKHNLDIQDQSAGIYFVKVIQQDKQHIIKLIKK